MGEVYPVFTVESIKNRCDKDIIDFTKQYSVEDITELQITTGLDSLETGLDSLENLNIAIKSIVDYIDNNLGYNNLGEFNNYVDTISHVDEDKQRQLWIARTYLFYQLLIFETVILQNENLYNEVFTEKIYEFRADIVNELPNFKMGIFGSNTPTSDIDLGIQYSGNTLDIPGLAYIVCGIESLFVIFTKKERGSLAYDIESYADMMTLPNTGTDKNEFPDYFYLDTSEFNENDYEKVLSCAGKSIVRNILLAYKDLDQDLNQINNITIENIIKDIKLKSLIKGMVPVNTEWFDTSKTEIIEFLKNPYNTQRKAYYKKVNDAETKKFEYTKDLVLLNKDKICELIILIGDALTYRMESYICAPTVIHVVRILQASKDKTEKYKTLVPKAYCKNEIQHLDPYCSMGQVGYMLSALEQIGYIYRFYLTYCDESSTHKDEIKCVKKQNKYMTRYDNAVYFYNNYKNLNDVIQSAGSMKTKKHSKHRKSKNPRRKSKNPRRTSKTPKRTRRTRRKQ